MDNTKALHDRGAGDIQIRIDDLNLEMDLLLRYLKDCNQRKLQLFKLALTVVAVLSGACFSIYAVYNEPAAAGIQSPFDLIFGLLLILIGAITLTIITELMSIHASRVITLRQSNCIRQALDCLRFQRIEGYYPACLEQLRDQNTTYWQCFGQHRKLPLENSGLRASEASWLLSPDYMMIGTLTFLSVIVLMTPLLFVGLSDTVGYRDGVFSGVVGMLFLAGIFVRWWIARQQLQKQLGPSQEDGKTP